MCFGQGEISLALIGILLFWFLSILRLLGMAGFMAFGALLALDEESVIIYIYIYI